VDYAAIGQTVAQSHMRREPVMKKITRFVGLDAHAETIAIAVAEKDGDVRFVATIANTPEAIRRAIKKLGPVESLRVCYEAGPLGYGLYWRLTEMGVHCDVIAPTLIPVRAGDRVKTDRRDAERLARCYRAGDLTPVWVPDAAHEAVRDLVRAREAAKKDQLRARHRLGKFLLRHDRRPPKTKAWGTAHMKWLEGVHFEHRAQEATLVDYKNEVDHARDRIERLERAIDVAVEFMPAKMRAVVDALQSLRGIAKLGAVTVVAEVGELSRFSRAPQLMSYTGVVSREDSSGDRVRRGAITKTGNAHLRRIVGEAAWAYQRGPALSKAAKKRQEGQSEPIKAMAWKAQDRLCRRFRRLAASGKPHQKVVTAVARELLGFIWAIGVHVEAGFDSARQQQAA
jgi:transposase